MHGGRSWKAGRTGDIGVKVPYRFEYRDGTGQLCLSGTPLPEDHDESCGRHRRSLSSMSGSLVEPRLEAADGVSAKRGGLMPMEPDKAAKPKPANELGAEGDAPYVAEDGAVLGRDFILPGVDPRETDPYRSIPGRSATTAARTRSRSSTWSNSSAAPGSSTGSTSACPRTRSRWCSARRGPARAC